MKKHRFWLFSCAVLILGLAAALVLPASLTPLARAEVRPAVMPKFITLSVDQKLLDVSWRCPSGRCEPWFLTHVMSQADEARTFTLNGNGDYVVSETRDGPAWPRAQETVFVTLPVDQRLAGVNWICRADGCALSFLTRTMQAGAVENGYIFTNGETEYYIRETRE
jgi:hypothetical protein